MIDSTAIVLIDVYNEFLHPDGKLYRTIEDSLRQTDTIKHLQTLVTAAHTHKIPIFYCFHQQTDANSYKNWRLMNKSLSRIRDNKAFAANTFSTEIFKGMEPDLDNGDVIVSKHWNSSSFANTDLEYQLKQRGIKHLVMAGLVANTCLESTARYGYELGYEMTMLSDSTAGFTHDAKEAAVSKIWPLFAEVKSVDEFVSGLGSAGKL